MFLCTVDMAEELCDGNAPLKDPRTRLEYSCDVGQDTCPAGSYCHKVGSIARCCREGGYHVKVGSRGYSQKWYHRDTLKNGVTGIISIKIVTGISSKVHS